MTNDASKMSRNIQTEKDKAHHANSSQSKMDDRVSVGCYMDVKLQNQLSKFLSPEFDVSINDVGEIINILNVIKAKCASTPEKFRLVIGLLCDVDLSITNIDEHYEQLLVKNRIYHLLRMFPDVAHPLLDVIARATNRCCPLASLPVTIGRIEEERQVCNNRFFITCNNIMIPGMKQSLHHSTCLKLSAQNKPTPAASPVTGIRQAGVLPPHGLAVVTQPTAYVPSVQVVTVTPPSNVPLVSGNQVTEFDMSRKMYQVPPSFLQSSMPVAIVNSTGARESSTDIQKRTLLLQQQQQLRQQLEMLQVQRQQQASATNLTIEQHTTSNAPACTVPHTPLVKMEQPAAASSTVIGPLDSAAQPMEVTQSCSQLSRQPIGGAVTNSRGGCDIQALDLRSPERRLATGNCEANSAKNSSVDAGDCDERGKVETEGACCEKEGAFRLSQVGRHCIVVSVRDGSDSTPEGGVCEVTKPQSGTGPGVEQAKRKTRHRTRKGKAAHRCKGAVIDVKKLCHMSDGQKSTSRRSDPTGRDKPGPTAATSARELKHNVRSQLVGHCSNAEPTEPVIEGNNNCNNKFDCRGPLTQPLGTNSSKKRQKYRQPSKSAKRRKCSGNQDSLPAKLFCDSEPEVVKSAIAFEGIRESGSPVPCTLTPTNNTGNLTASTATFEPTTGFWLRKPDDEKADNTNQPQHQGFNISQPSPEVRSPESAYLLYSGCDDEAWYQSSQSDEVDRPSNQSTASPAAGQSNVGLGSPVRPGSSVQPDQQKSVVSGALGSAVVLAVDTAKPAPVSTEKRNLPRTRQNQKTKKH